MLRFTRSTIPILLCLGLAACAPRGIPATPTKTPIPSPTATVAVMPSPSPTIDLAVPPDLSAVVLAPADVPPGFIAAPVETMTPVAAQFSQAPFYDVIATSGFALARETGPELIVTFAGTFTEDNPYRDDAPATQKPLFAAYMFVLGTGAQAITGDGDIPDLGGIGDEAHGYFATSDLNGQPIRVDLVTFRRGRVGVYVFHLYPASEAPSVSVVPLTRLLDQRLTQSLAAP